MRTYVQPEKQFVPGGDCSILTCFCMPSGALRFVFCRFFFYAQEMCLLRGVTFCFTVLCLFGLEVGSGACPSRVVFFCYIVFAFESVNNTGKTSFVCFRWFGVLLICVVFFSFQSFCNGRVVC